ncbi:serine hydrolase [Corynebacterium sp. P5875]|uniref:Serine hydrolase n=1 Tax=Corynebacterium antarcticum TaxID=2800405 RepID=A0A9Q4CAQ2_9CORY|nr:serine hydrolase domain-containing protein [Corynebacterium antarcticum]MCX7537314.1 serine hydrolase [Corynebacterium antarcticum]
MTSSVTLSELERVARAHFVAADLPGAVLHVVTSDGPLLTVEHGELSVGTPVMLGSTSKSMTAALLLQHVDEGLLRLDDPATRYLTDAELPEDITLSDLACHVSGLRTDTTPGRLTRRQDRSFNYANQNYNLLGQVLSTASGVSFGRLLSARILEPLGMQHSGSAPDVIGTRGRTNVLGKNCPAMRADFGPESWIQGPSGGVVASSEDAGRFLSMILSGGTFCGRQILSQCAIDTMLNSGVTVQRSPAVSDAFGDSGVYGFGWVKKDIAGHAVHTHSGKVPQSTSVFGLVPDLGIAFVLVANLGDFLVRTPLLEDLGGDIIRVLLNLPIKELPAKRKARIRQSILNLAYAAFLTVGVFGWHSRTRPRRVEGSLLYHAVLPTALMLGIRRASGTPWPWLFRFAPDAIGVLTVGCLSMLTSGLERMATAKRKHGPTGTA